jgi:hypothetical protein
MDRGFRRMSEKEISEIRSLTFGYVCEVRRLRCASLMITLGRKAAVPDSGATVQEEAQEAADVVLEAMDSPAWNSRYRIAVTGMVCRKLDKRAQHRQQNPNPSDKRRRDRVRTR